MGRLNRKRVEVDELAKELAADVTELLLLGSEHTFEKMLREGTVVPVRDEREAERLLV